jgi:hypothetical protein
MGRASVAAFLAYLLIMALMHVREEDQGRTGATH